MFWLNPPINTSPAASSETSNGVQGRLATVLNCCVDAVHIATLSLPWSAMYKLPWLSTASPPGVVSPEETTVTSPAGTRELPAWVTVRVVLPTFTYPVRVAPELASKVNVITPLPPPLPVVCSQDAVGAALQLPPVRTMDESLPAAGPSSSEVVTKVTEP